MDAHSVELIWLVGALLIGLINCYLGYRLFMVTVAIVGFVIGASFGYLIGSWIGGNILIIGITLVLGLLGAWVGFVGYYLFIFMVGAFGFAFVTAFLWGLYSQSGSVLLPIIAGVIGGFLALRLQRIIIIIATAAQGAIASIFAAVAIFSGGGLLTYRTLFHRLLSGDLDHIGGIRFYAGVFAWLILFSSGLAAQFTRGKEMYKQRRSKTPAPAS